MLKMVNLEVLVYYEHVMNNYQSYYPSAAELARSSRLSGGMLKSRCTTAHVSLHASQTLPISLCVCRMLGAACLQPL